MDLDRANQIIDGVGDLLADPDEFPGGFNSLSRTGARTRVEIFHAACLVTAQLFLSESVKGKNTGKDSEFSDFLRALDSSVFSALFLRPCLPDAELSLIGNLSRHSDEYRREESRLQELAMKDGAMNLERMESFVAFLRSVDFSGPDYWPLIYGRICLACPDYLVPVSAVHSRTAASSSAEKDKPWWRFW